MPTSPANQATASQSGLIDPLVDSLLDFTEYDNAAYQSPSLSPTATSKSSFSRPIKAETSANSLLPTNRPMNGPSHQYELYKQQTGIVPGALASTFAINQSNSQVQGYSNLNLDYLGVGAADDLFDFNTTPSQASMNPSDVDMDFGSPAGDHGFFFGDATVNPNSIGGQEPNALPSPPGLAARSSNMGRLWPGMHQQAALAKAQAQRQQQHQIIQRQQNAQAQQAKSQHRAKATQPSDPIVEQKITQLLHTMRARAASPESSQNAALLNMPRPKKDEDDMDEDERLLASEEGKKLSSKERRQLRNKVSARAFRSRRKEYITQLEAEIANKVNENGDLRAHNRALVEENKRLSDLTRMLLSSPSFSDFLDRLSSNPHQLPSAQPSQPQHEQRQLPKDVNPYNGRSSNQQIGMAMIPEQTMDLSMLNLDSADSFNFQPQVYAVLETPEPAVIDTSVLSGKTSNFVGAQLDADEKIEMPVIEKAPVAPAQQPKSVEAVATPVVDEDFENDPAFALYHDIPAAEEHEAPVELDTQGFSHADIFGGIEPEKVLARYELVDATEEEATATLAMARVQRISASLESVATRLEMLTVNL